MTTPSRTCARSWLPIRLLPAQPQSAAGERSTSILILGGTTPNINREGHKSNRLRKCLTINGGGHN
jgi:hypothetical protein